MKQFVLLLPSVTCAVWWGGVLPPWAFVMVCWHSKVLSSTHYLTVLPNRWLLFITQAKRERKHMLKKAFRTLLQASSLPMVHSFIHTLWCWWDILEHDVWHFVYVQPTVKSYQNACKHVQNASQQQCVSHSCLVCWISRSCHFDFKQSFILVTAALLLFSQPTSASSRKYTMTGYRPLTAWWYTDPIPKRWDSDKCQQQQKAMICQCCFWMLAI